MTAIGEDGGSPILSYGLEIDDGAGGAFVPIAGLDPVNAPYTLNSKLWTTAISSGKFYKLRYRAYNIHGWGAYSPESTIVAATVPYAPGEPALTIDVTQVMITWTAPTNPGGVNIPILSYTIEIRLRDGTTFLEEPISCSGADATIRDNRVCRIPIPTLTSAPFSFV